MTTDQTEPGDTTIWCHSIFGAQTRKGLVGLTIGDRKPIYMSPAEARSVASDLLQTAAAAEMDETMVTWLTTKMDLEHGQAVGALRELRKVRDQMFPSMSRPPARHGTQ